MKKTDKVEAELAAKCHAYATWLSEEFFRRMRQRYGGTSLRSERESVYSAFYQQGRDRFDKSRARP